MLKKFLLAVRSGFAWDRARQHSYRGNHAEALAVIESQPAWITASIPWTMLRLQQHYALGNFGDAKQVAGGLAPAIAAAKNLSPVEKRYAEAYVAWLTAKMGSDSGHVAEEIFAGVDLAQVPNSWKENFPMRGHPRWPKEETPRNARVLQSGQTGARRPN